VGLEQWRLLFECGGGGRGFTVQWSIASAMVGRISKSSSSMMMLQSRGVLKLEEFCFDVAEDCIEKENP
jgi:hypothetical protein